MNQTITEKKLLKQFITTNRAANRAANQRLSIMFKCGYPLPQSRLKNEPARL